MKKLLLAGMWCCAALAAQAQAPGVWLTVTGQPGDASVDTIQVDPIPLDTGRAGRVMRVRVSRAQPRTNWDGLPYRSYDARVLFDCPRQAAHYVSVSYYLEPLWRGESYRTVEYDRGSVRPMLFRDVVPNPTERLVRAACAN